MPKTGSYYGYIEGYYGQLLSFADRGRILKQLNTLGMNSYFYAPKDDPYHRFHWRQPYPEAWWPEWQDFIAAARDQGVTVIAGLAPGLDLDVNLDGDNVANTDIAVLAKKLGALAADDHVIPCLLLDDIPPAKADQHGQHHHEGQSHARLAYLLAQELGRPVMVTPRVYADELETLTPGYLAGFAEAWDAQAEIFYCGHHIVAHDTHLPETEFVKAGLPASQMIIWDNLYANDYCPRRLFLGPWGGEGRRRQHLFQKTAGIMLNPTGLIETDLLLLAIMAAGDDTDSHKTILQSHGVPDAFDHLQHSFSHPPFPSGETPPLSLNDTDTMLEALDEMCWRWKSPLAQEWYPFLMGLRGDLLMLRGEADALRQAKILPPYLYHYMKGQSPS